MWPEIPQRVPLPIPLTSRCRVFGCDSPVAYLHVGVSPNHVGLYCERGDWQGRWIAHSAFLTGGLYDGVLPKDWFDKPSGRKRDKTLAIRDGVRYETLLAADGECVVCGRQAPGQKNPAYLRLWLKMYHPDLHRRVAEEFDNQLGAGKLINHSNWMDLVPCEMRDEVRAVVERSQLDADHVIPVWLVRLMRETIESKLGKAAFASLANECCVPLCRSCNAGRPRRGLEPTQVLEDRYVKSKFAGNRRVAENSEQFKTLRQALIYAAAHVQQLEASGA